MVVVLKPSQGPWWQTVEAGNRNVERMMEPNGAEEDAAGTLQLESTCCVRVALR